MKTDSCQRRWRMGRTPASHSGRSEDMLSRCGTWIQRSGKARWCPAEEQLEAIRRHHTAFGHHRIGNHRKEIHGGLDRCSAHLWTAQVQTSKTGTLRMLKNGLGQGRSGLSVAGR